MCLTIVGKIIKVKGKKGIALVEGKKQELNLELVNVKKEDFVSCAAGLAVEKLGAAEAKSILKARKDLIEQK